jgi:hypothetical protein
MSELHIESFGKNVMADFKNGVVMTPLGTAPTSSVPDDLTINGVDEWIKWGDANNFPQQVVAMSEPSTIIGPAISKLVKLGHSGGVQAGIISYENGKEVFTPVWDDEFEDFKRKSNLDAYVLEALSDFFWFGNVFSNLVLNKGKDKIVQLFVEEACYCRWEKPNLVTGRVENCFISANWDKTNFKKDQLIKVKVLDQYYDPADQIRRNLSAMRFVYPISFPSPNRHWYQLAPWNGAITSGWLKFSLQIPEFKTAMMKNQLTLKYHLEVNEDYWPLEYAGWKDKTAAEKQTAKQQFLLKFTENLADTKNAAKAIMTSFKYERNNEERKMWKITAIDDKIKSGVYVEDSQEASTHLMNALELDPTLFGNGPGKGFSAGSGSDKNSAYNLLMVALKPIHNLILQPLYVIRDFNKMNPKLQFRMANTFMAESTSGKPKMVDQSTEAIPAKG